MSRDVHVSCDLHVCCDLHVRGYLDVTFPGESCTSPWEGDTISRIISPPVSKRRRRGEM